MIRSGAIWLALSWAGLAHAQSDEGEAPAPAAETDAPAEVSADGEEPGLDESEEDPLSKHRTRFDVLTDRTIGTSSRPVAFNWRRTSVHVAGTGSVSFELNNFNTMRVGGMVRIPTGGMLVEFAVDYVDTWDSPSSRLLALTPYRQPGRPDRMEIDATLALPLAEGIVTVSPRWFPSVELVFNAYVEMRYLLYPTGFAQMKPGKVVGAILNPAMTPEEIENLEGARLDAMMVDPGRYGFLAGYGNDIYFEQGIFVSPRFMVAVPLLAPANGSELRVWVDAKIAIGMAF